MKQTITLHHFASLTCASRVSLSMRTQVFKNSAKRPASQSWCQCHTTKCTRRAGFVHDGPNKAPGVDGFTAGFFQRHWPLLKENVTQAVLNFLNGGDMPELMNITLLVLIQKVVNPQELSQYRPISLCNVLYKLCSKVMANRLRLILGVIVSEE